jgi:ribosome biogenesis GTPase
MIIAGRMGAIPLSLVVNKQDLGFEHVTFITSVYERMGIPVLPVSAKAEQGLDQLTSILDSDSCATVALCGVSGVGKSTILNKLVPGAKAKIGELSERTGQGKQTTTQPRGFLYRVQDKSPKVIIDFPGVGYFGLSHVDPIALMDAFDEMRSVKGQCRFLDCRHLQEPGCVVRDQVESGEIAGWRYQSYLQILQEIEDAKAY